jgi:hypothetical protein
VETHDAVVRPPSSRDDGEAEDEKPVREERSEDGRLGDDDLAGAEREHDDEELG